jgi:hypothetical protein
MRPPLVALYVVAVVCCCESKATRPATASSTSPASPSAPTTALSIRPLPVKYESCNEGGRDCYVTAAFADMAGCENYRRIVASYCDIASAPGIVVCNRAGPPGCDTARVPGSITCPLAGTTKVVREISASHCITRE